MDAKIEGLLHDMEARWRKEQAEQADIGREAAYSRVDDYLLPVGPETGRLMSDLIRATRAQLVVEVGSSYGYSTLWLADAAREVGGRVVSLEIHPGKIAAASATLASAGLSDIVEFIEGDAVASLESLEGPVDFALIDLWKDLYIPCFGRLAGKLSPGALIVADNITFPPDNAENAAAYRAHIRTDARFESLLLPIGAGLEITRRLP